jgi:hypothetical protein
MTFWQDCLEGGSALYYKYDFNKKTLNIRTASIRRN